jgi:hypothetical protein
MSPKSARQFLAIQPPAFHDSRVSSLAREVLKKAPALLAEFEAQSTLDRAGSAILAEVEVPAEVLADLSAQTTQAAAERGRARLNPRDPALLAVGIGVLLLAVILTWHFLGRAGVFPEEALTIAAEGAKLGTAQFEVTQEKAGSLEDWFMLKGFDRFSVPPKFESYQAAGARVSKIEGQPVAVLAIPENFMFFLVFDPAPLGIQIQPDGTWRLAEFDYKYAAAIREDNGMCFMVVIKGTKKDLAQIIEKQP